MASPRGLSLEIDKSQQSGSQLSGPRQRACYCSLLVLVASKELPGDLNFPLSAVVKKGTFFTVGSGVFCCDLTEKLRCSCRLQVLYHAPRALRCCCPWLSSQGQNRGQSARHKCQASNHLKLAGKAGLVWALRSPCFLRGCRGPVPAIPAGPSQAGPWGACRCCSRWGQGRDKAVCGVCEGKARCFKTGRRWFRCRDAVGGNVRL